MIKVSPEKNYIDKLFTVLLVFCIVFTFSIATLLIRYYSKQDLSFDQWISLGFIGFITLATFITLCILLAINKIIPSKKVRISLISAMVIVTVFSGTIFAHNHLSIIKKEQLIHNTNESLQSSKSTTNNLSPTESVSDISKSRQESTQNTKNNNETSCIIKDIPFVTEYRDAIWLYKGETEVTALNEGKSGKEEVCYNSDGKIVSNQQTAPVSNRIVYIGTKAYVQEPPSAPQYTFEQALHMATETCRQKGYYADSTDMTYCKTKEMKNYGY